MCVRVLNSSLLQPVAEFLIGSSSLRLCLGTISSFNSHFKPFREENTRYPVPLQCLCLLCLSIASKGLNVVLFVSVTVASIIIEPNGQQSCGSLQSLRELVCVIRENGAILLFKVIPKERKLNLPQKLVLNNQMMT